MLILTLLIALHPGDLNKSGCHRAPDEVDGHCHESEAQTYSTVPVPVPVAAPEPELAPWPEAAAPVSNKGAERLVVLLLGKLPPQLVGKMAPEEVSALAAKIPRGLPEAQIAKLIDLIPQLNVNVPAVLPARAMQKLTKKLIVGLLDRLAAKITEKQGRRAGKQPTLAVQSHVASSSDDSPRPAPTPSNLQNRRRGVLTAGMISGYTLLGAAVLTGAAGAASIAKLRGQWAQVGDRFQDPTSINSDIADTQYKAVFLSSVGGASFIISLPLIIITAMRLRTHHRESIAVVPMRRGLAVAGRF